LPAYKIPATCSGKIHDQGPKFTAPPFQADLIRNDIKPGPIPIKNPQANAIFGHLCGTMKNQLHTIFHSNPPQDIGDVINVINFTILASTVFVS
jgi:hypothetical protein